MKISKIFKLKLKYFINKYIIISFVLYLLLITFCMFIEVINIDNKKDDIEIIGEYLINSYLYIKIFSVFLSVFIFSYSISFKNDFLIYLLLPLGVKREKSLIITIFLNTLIITLLYLIIFIIFSYLGLSINGFYVNEEIILSFLNILFLSITFGLYSMMINQIFKNSASNIIMLLIFISANNLIEHKESILIKIFSLIIPILDQNGIYMYHSMYLIMLIVLLVFINLLIYHYRDLNF